MPAGISNPVLGYATFCAIKFAGYSAAGHFLSVQYDRDVSAWKVGAVRTLIGMAAGAAYSGLWLVIDPNVFQPRAEPSSSFRGGILPGSCRCGSSNGGC
jgi:hypothetical protein